MGVNVTLIVQTAASAKVEPQLLVWAKSPITATLLIVRAAVPVFWTLTVKGALVEPTSWPPKSTEVGTMYGLGKVAGTPVPVKGKV